MIRLVKLVTFIFQIQKKRKLVEMSDCLSFLLLYELGKFAPLGCTAYTATL